MNCPNLEEIAGNKYRLGWDASRVGKERDKWLRLIPCAKGAHIYPHGPDELGVSIEGRKSGTVRKLKAIGCIVTQLGDDGANLIFPVSSFDAVAEIVKPIRRIRVSAERRAALAISARNLRLKAPKKAQTEAPATLAV